MKHKYLDGLETCWKSMVVDQALFSAMNSAWTLLARQSIKTGEGKIEAIKLYRLLYDEALFEAKQAVEHYIESQKYQHIHDRWNTMDGNSYSPTKYMIDLTTAGMNIDTARSFVLAVVEKRLRATVG